MTRARSIVMTKRSLERSFTSRSSLPVLLFGLDAFSTARVSAPVYTTHATTVQEAITVLAHTVCSRVSDSTECALSDCTAGRARVLAEEEKLDDEELGSMKEEEATDPERREDPRREEG